MGVCAQAKRTLVKSPPELWSELSDPAALARHLGELGEIRIVRSDPEKSVEWEAAEISGTVLIEPSGWGTKVTLTATRTQAPATDAQSDESVMAREPASMSEPASISEPVSEPTTTLVAERGESIEPEPTPQPQPGAIGAIEPQPEPTPQPQPETVVVILSEPAPELQAEALELPEPVIEPEPRLGFFARLFGRRRMRRERDAPSRLDAVVESAPLAVEQSWPEDPIDEHPASVVSAPETTVTEDPTDMEPALQTPALEQRAMPDTPPPALEATGVVEPFAADAPAVRDEPPAPDEPTAPHEPRAPHEPTAHDEPTAHGEPTAPDEPTAPGERPTPDISAELAEAEQLGVTQDGATDDVTAVLTSVLDRLGAAHHRPFSRA